MTTDLFGAFPLSRVTLPSGLIKDAEHSTIVLKPNVFLHPPNGDEILKARKTLGTGTGKTKKTHFRAAFGPIFLET